MRRIINWLVMASLLSLIAMACSPATPEPQPTPPPPPPPTPEWAKEGWELVWQDEFMNPEINLENWVFDLGGGGWGNNELQLYTSRPENARIENGILVIEAREGDYAAATYTSARLKTEGLQTFTYGRIEARMKLPYGPGIWPAFWMLGEDTPTIGWPDSGEIDIMEHIGRNPYHVYGTIHGPGYSGGSGIGGSYILPDTPVSEDFHVFAVEWEPDTIRWYIDDINYFTVTSSEVPGQWVYDHPFFIILNLAVGGNWPGSPNSTTVFPQQFLVDYVRVYRSLNPSTGLPTAGGDMFIQNISLEITETGGERQGVVNVQVVDDAGNPVQGARVTGGWLGVVRLGDGDMTTGPDGVAGPFLSEKTTRAGEISFCVTSIVGGGHTYAKPKNQETCKFFVP